MIHGKYGEDGKLQGFLDLIKVPYIGCEELSSSVCMDKLYTKKLLKASEINVAKDIVLKNIDNKYYQIDNSFNLKEVSIKDIDNIIKK